MLWQGTVHCPYYMKTGTCKYGATCKFDHPPPGEVMAMAAAQGTSTTVGQDEKGDVKTQLWEAVKNEQLDGFMVAWWFWDGQLECS